MAWTSNYIAPKPSAWEGRKDAPTNAHFFQIIQLLDLLQPIPTTVDNIKFGLVGFCCDEGVKRNYGRIGAEKGPSYLRQVLAKLPVHRENITVYDAGDIVCIDGDLEKAQNALASVVEILLKNNITPIIIGGGHELAWGHYQGIAKTYPRKNLTILNFDAHFDMRPLLANQLGSSGTPFLQIAEAREKEKLPFSYYCAGIQRTGNTEQLFATAAKYHTEVLYADDLMQDNANKSTFFKKLLTNKDKLYLTLCLDVFASAYAPGVSAPQALGITPWQIMPYIQQLAASGNVISYDIAELCPEYDIDLRTAKLAANFIYAIIHHHQQ